MNSVHYTDQILDSIQILVDNSVAKAKYDRTLKATILKVIDKTIGKYSVKYQDSTFYAYSNNTNITYAEDSLVYILVPNNDSRQNKIIIGSADKFTTNIKPIDIMSGYEKIGKNCFDYSGEQSLNSYSEEEKDLYNRDTGVNIIGLNKDDVNTYLSRTEDILISMQVRTDLPEEQKSKGNYGLAVECEYQSVENGVITTKKYIIDINQMTGNPYNFKQKTEQRKIFSAPGYIFKEIKRVYIFSKSFPNNTIGKPQDLFFSDFMLFGIQKIIQESEIGTLILNTPQGEIFREGIDILNLIAEIKINGEVLEDSDQKVEYYWFKQNNAIDISSEKYNTYGGLGWECLNNFNIVEDITGTKTIEWISALKEYQVKKEDFDSEFLDYKCVAVLENGDVVKRTKTLKKEDAKYKIIITSNRGTEFYQNSLETFNLICDVSIDGVSIGDLSSYSFSWSELDNNNNIELIDRKENMIEVKTTDIIEFSTFSCSVYKDNIFIGTSSLLIKTNVTPTADFFTLIIDNAQQSFQYDENGLAPTLKEIHSAPQEIKTLTFKLLDKTGKDITEYVRIEDVKWIFPTQDTLIKNPNIGENNEVVFGKEPLIFDLEKYYVEEYNNNVITLEVKYNNQLMVQSTNFVFSKKGKLKENGTSHICKIVLLNNENVNYPVVRLPYTGSKDLNFEPKAPGRWFGFQIWDDGKKKFEEPLQNDRRLTWEIYKGKDEVSNFYFTQEGLILQEYDFTYKDNPVNIVKATYRGDDGENHEAYMPIITYRDNKDYGIEIDENSGFKKITYDGKGLNPKFDNTTGFNIKVNSNKEYAIDWGVCGEMLRKDTENGGNGKNIQYYLPSNAHYNGLTLNNAVSALIKAEDGTEVGYVHIPVEFLIDGPTTTLKYTGSLYSSNVNGCNGLLPLGWSLNGNEVTKDFIEILATIPDNFIITAAYFEINHIPISYDTNNINKIGKTSKIQIYKNTKDVKNIKLTYDNSYNYKFDFNIDDFENISENAFGDLEGWTPKEEEYKIVSYNLRQELISMNTKNKRFKILSGDAEPVAENIPATKGAVSATLYIIGWTDL